MKRVTFGPLPGKPQTVPHSEHFALEMAMDRITGDTTVYTDCQGVIDYDLMGMAAAGSKLPFAGIWRRILGKKGVFLEL